MKTLTLILAVACAATLSGCLFIPVPVERKVIVYKSIEKTEAEPRGPVEEPAEETPGEQAHDD